METQVKKLIIKNKGLTKEESKTSSERSKTDCIEKITSGSEIIQNTEHITKKKTEISIKKRIVTDVENTNPNRSSLCHDKGSEPDSKIAIQSENVEINDKKKIKAKKGKKVKMDQQNISVKTSFSKFDALQKQNLIHSPQDEKEVKCRLCSKPVYKMEEIKAEKSIFHKNCFRCNQCNKQLSVDNYQSHEGVLFCSVHFKMLFVPKVAENNEPEEKRKPELIIRENQPVDLPPDVARASNKPDLGLKELQQMHLNVRSRFEVFENQLENTKADQYLSKSSNNFEIKHSNSLLSKLAKLQSRGVAVGLEGNVEDIKISNEVHDSDNNTDDSNSDEHFDLDFPSSKNKVRAEIPTTLGHAMSDIKDKFERGQLTKEDRREERKQEIQNIRSRLFMGKQARIKEMYQQAVAESEQGNKSSGKQPDIEFTPTTRLIKERFEKGEIFKDAHSENEDEGQYTHGVHIEPEVFESGIGKQSRNIFMELDASILAAKNGELPSKLRTHDANRLQLRNGCESELEKTQSGDKMDTTNIVRCDEKVEDIKIKTSEISSKFKFFETYQPAQREKKAFRITPPREGVVKLPTPDSDNEQQKMEDESYTDVVKKSQTTSTMLNKFRELENQIKHTNSSCPKPLKCFTPPPEGEKRVYQQDSDSESQDETDDSMDEDDGNDYSKYSLKDEALKEAQAAARAKYLRAKFEKWEANEVRRELDDEGNDIYSKNVSDDSTIESTKTLRERFEKMNDLETRIASKPQYQVNRFV